MGLVIEDLEETEPAKDEDQEQPDAESEVKSKKDLSYEMFGMDS